MVEATVVSGDIQYYPAYIVSNRAAPGPLDFLKDLDKFQVLETKVCSSTVKITLAIFQENLPLLLLESGHVGQIVPV